MNIHELLAEAVRAGITLWVDDGRLRFRAPEGALPPALKERLSAHKQDLIEVINSAHGGRVSPETAAELAGAEFPLTEMQQAYWLGRRDFYDLGEVSAHGYFEFESQSLDIDRLEAAWQVLVARHDMLRAVIQTNGRQRILDRVAPYRIERIDLTGQPRAAVDERLQRERERMSHQVLPLDTWPMFEIKAAVLDAPRRVRLLLSLDMLILDARSLTILFEEWSQAYRDPASLGPPPGISFRSCALARADKSNTAGYQRSLAYWRQRVTTMPMGPELGAPAARGGHGSRFSRRTGRLDRDRWARLQSMAQGRGLTPSLVLCAAFARVLSRWSHRPHFSLNLTLLGRDPVHADVDRVLGDFTSGLLLEIDDTPAQSFVSFARALKERFWKDMEHSQVSSVTVLRELTRYHGRLEASMPVVFTSLLDRTGGRTGGQAAGGDYGELIGWLGERVYAISQTPQVSLDHQVYQDHGQLAWNWDAVESRFRPGQVDAMFAAYQDLLERLADDEAAWERADVELVPAELMAAQRAANDTDHPVSDELLHTLFTRRAARQPDDVAVIAGDRRLTYAELDRVSSRVARSVRDHITPGDDTLVAVVMDKGWEQVAAVLGILKAGAAYLPIDPTVPGARLRYLLDDGRVRVALTQPHLAGLGWPDGVTCVALSARDLDGDVDGPGPEPLPVTQTPASLAYVIYTSGSTGRPKGVMIDHRGAVNTLLDINERFSVQRGDRVLAVSSLSFDLSVYDIFGALAAGAAIVVPTGDSDPAHWAELIEREQVTVWNSVPVLFETLLEVASFPGPAARSSLRLALLSGDWISVSLPDRARARLPHMQMISLGGATEGSIWSILYPIGDVDPSWASIPYGRPMRNQRIYVLDHALAPRPPGVTGDIYIGGVGVAQGYWRDAERTAAQFIDHPRWGERLYRTGDLGRWREDGTVELLGREDNQVKIRGHRIELGEIEAALRRLPGVREAICQARDPGDGRKVLVGYVLRSPEYEIDEAALRKGLRDELPGYMVPAHIAIVDAWPLSANGKVDMRALAAYAGDAGVEQDTGGAGAREPHTDAERAVAELLGQVLGIDRPDVRASFFELGGDSLKAIQLATLIRNAFEVEFPMRRLLEQPTVEGIAALLEEALIDELMEEPA